MCPERRRNHHLHDCRLVKLIGRETKTAAVSSKIMQASDRQKMAGAVGIELVLNEIIYVLLEPIGQGGFGSVYKASRKSQAVSW